MDACSVCAKPHDQPHKRPRRCKACSAATVVKRRRDDPVKLLQHRWYNSCRKSSWIRNATLWSPATVQYVYQRWEKRSIISGTCEPEDLRIVPYHGKDHGVPKTQELVLVTAREAQVLSKKTGTTRASYFPPEVAQRINVN